MFIYGTRLDVDRVLRTSMGLLPHKFPFHTALGCRHSRKECILRTLHREMFVYDVEEVQLIVCSGNTQALKRASACCRPYPGLEEGNLDTLTSFDKVKCAWEKFGKVEDSPQSYRCSAMQCKSGNPAGCHHPHQFSASSRIDLEQ